MERILTNPRQILIGCMILLLGMVVYLFNRPAWQFTLLPDFLFTQWVSGGMADQFGGSLPSFLHVLGFSVLSAGIIATSKKGYRLICGLWSLINISFEILQADIFLMPEEIYRQEVTVGHSLFVWLQDYARNTVFDFYDLLAILLGAICAYRVLTRTQKREV